MKAANTDHSFNSSWTQIRVQCARYFSLLRRRWWVLLLTASLGLCAAAWFISQQPPSYLSMGRMMVSGQIRLSEGAQYTEELFNFFGTQVELMQSGEVRQRAHERVQALHPEIPREEVRLEVGQVPKASIFMLRAIGKSPFYTQAYLDACMEEYIATKKAMRSQKSERTTVAIGDELVQLEKEMEERDEEMHTFQRQNNVGFLQEEGNSAGIYLAQLNRQLADLRTEYDLIALLDLEQNLDRQQAPLSATERAGTRADNSLPAFGPLGEYQKAKQALDQLYAERAELSRYLRPKHPIMVDLGNQISRGETLLETFRNQSVETLKNRRDAIRLQITNLEANIKLWEEKALDLSQRIAEFNKIKSKSERTKAQYERLLASYRSVDVTKRVDQDMISILEKASPAVSTRPGLATILAIGFTGGALLGLTVLFVLDKLDDRVGSFMEFRAHFSENLLGQIPHESSKGAFSLLVPNDTRHALAESFRTLRSSIVFLPVERARPKTLLVTSATPCEGKTTVSANLAISLAFSGARTLLIDGDLRRGRLHTLFNIEEQQGFSKVLQQRINWRDAVLATSVPNLAILPRGRTLSHPGEHFLGKVTDHFLQEIYSEFDYIVIDSAPVMAADDTLSLAPKMDGTIFVVRFSVSSAKTSRKSLELLMQRQVNLLGIVCNDVKLSESEYGYGYYYEYTGQNKEVEASA